MAAPQSFDAYIAAAAPESRQALEAIRQTVRAAVPDATETFGYQMPAFRQGKIFFYFAAFKKHIGVYPPLHGDAALEAELAPYANQKGNLKFKLGEPVPLELIARLATALAAQYSG